MAPVSTIRCTEALHWCDHMSKEMVSEHLGAEGAILWALHDPNDLLWVPGDMIVIERVQREFIGTSMHPFVKDKTPLRRVHVKEC